MNCWVLVKRKMCAVRSQWSLTFDILTVISSFLSPSGHFCQISENTPKEFRYHIHKWGSFKHGTIRFLFSFIISGWYSSLASCYMFPVLLLIFYLLSCDISPCCVSICGHSTFSEGVWLWLIYSQINESLSVLTVLWTSLINLVWLRWWIKAFFLFCLQ